VFYFYPKGKEMSQMATGGRLLDKALNAAGGREAFDRKFRQYEESVSFIDRNREELLKKYDDKWVVVYNAKVVADGEKYEDVARKIHREGLPIEEVVIKFLTSRKMLTLF